MSNNQEKIVVAGATGNIGSPVVAGLIAKGYQPQVVVQKKVSNADWEAAKIEQIEADMSKVDSLRKAFSGADSRLSGTQRSWATFRLSSRTLAARDTKKRRNARQP